MRQEKREMWRMGTAFWTNPKSSLPSHLHVVLSDPPKDAERIVVVNATTIRDEFDASCVLKTGDHDAIRQPSYMEYRRAWVVNLNALAQLSEGGQIHRHLSEKVVRPEVLKRMQKGAMASPKTPAKVKGILAEQGLG